MFDFLKLKKNFKLFQKKDQNKKKNKENEKKIKTNPLPVDLSGARCSHDNSADLSPGQKNSSFLFGFIESPEIPKHCPDLTISCQNYIESAFDKSNNSIIEISNLKRDRNEKIDPLNSPRDGFFSIYTNHNLDKTKSKIENRKSNLSQSLNSISSPGYMTHNNTIPMDVDNPIFLSKFPNADVKNHDQIIDNKYENMIFESAFNDYVSIIRGTRFKNSSEENWENLDRLLKIYQIELCNIKEDGSTKCPTFEGQKMNIFTNDLKDDKIFKNCQSLNYEDPVFLSRFANAYQADHKETWCRFLNLNQKLKYKNLIFESEYNDYVSFIRAEHNRIKRYKRSSSLQELYGTEDFLDPWKSSRSRNAKSVPRIQTRYLFPLNASASRICRTKCKSLGNLNNFEKKNSIFKYLDLKINKNGSYNEDENESNCLQRSNIEAFLKPGYGQSGKIYKPKMEPFFVALASITPNSSMHRQDLSGLVTNSDTVEFTENYQIYPYDLLRSSPKKSLPEDIDRKNLERHLSEEEFQKIFDMSYNQFHKLPDWKKVELKKLVKLF